jgi:hypothetical protein
MNRSRSMRIAICAAVVGGALAGPVAGASASDASIKAVIKSYNSKILVAEGHALTALGEYKSTGNPANVQSALTQSIDVLSSLKSKIAGQSASSSKVKEGKAKFEKGLAAVIVAYRRLKTAIGEKKSSPEAAKTEAKKAVSAVKVARKELLEGAKLLS